MSDNSPRHHDSNFVRRLLWADLGDLFPWKVATRGIDPRQAIEESDLPEQLAERVSDVVKGTRLWRREKVDVARELCAHFRDGLEAGASEENLLNHFGDARKTAAMIRRAKLRLRPLPYRIARWVRRAIAYGLLAIVVLWTLLFIRYQFARPSIKVDYVAEFDSAAKSIPAEERAWPLYREIVLSLDEEEIKRFNSALAAEEVAHEHPDEPPLERNMGSTRDWIRAHAELLPKIREAARRPELGFIYDDPGNDEYYQRLQTTREEMANPSEGTIMLRLPYIENLRFFARILRVDADLAAGEDRAEDFHDSVIAMIDIAEQNWRRPDFLIKQLSALGLFDLAMDTLKTSLLHHPELLSSEQLTDLAHRLAAFDGGGRIVIDFGAEFLMHQDILQRMYTDDGAGNGYATGRGSLVDRYANKLGTDGPNDDYPFIDRAARDLVGSTLPVFMASRQEVTAKLKKIQLLAAEDAATDPWKRDGSKADKECEKLRANSIDRMRFWPVNLLTPSVESCNRWADQTTLKRDATLVTIALELYRREHGDWPATLDALTPRLLPAVPRDIADGRPIRYAIVDGRPTLYSLGQDKKDNGGKVDPKKPKSFDVSPGHDWVLWPPAEDENGG